MTVEKVIRNSKIFSQMEQKPIKNIFKIKIAFKLFFRWFNKLKIYLIYFIDIIDNVKNCFQI